MKRDLKADLELCNKATLERALKAEEAVQSLLVALKKFEENLSRYVCGGWMCSNDDLHYARQEDRELCAEYCELGNVRKKFDEELVRILGVLGDEDRAGRCRWA